MLTRKVFTAAVAFFALTAQAHAGSDPFLKERQGRLSHDMNMKALGAGAGGARVPGVRAASLRGGQQGMVTAVVELERGADAAGVRSRVLAAGGRVLVGIDHLL